MSKDLPLWNDRETDVLSEYRLQFGHVLLTKHSLTEAAEQVQKTLSLGRPVDSYAFVKHEALMYDKDKKVFLLEGDGFWHFVFAEFACNVIAIYGPHFLFFNTRQWAKLNKKMKGWLFFVTQGDVDEWFYNIFQNGNHYCNAYWDSTGVHKLTRGPVEVYVNQKQVYSDKTVARDLTSHLRQLIASDVILAHNARGEVQFQSPMASEPLQPSSVLHVVFSAGKREH